MLDAKLADDIVAAVDAGFADQVKLTQDLVRYPSLRGQEHTAQDFLHDQMARRCRSRSITATPSTWSAATARARLRASR